MARTMYSYVVRSLLTCVCAKHKTQNNVVGVVAIISTFPFVLSVLRSLRFLHEPFICVCLACGHDNFEFISSENDWRKKKLGIKHKCTKHSNHVNYNESRIFFLSKKNEKQTRTAYAPLNSICAAHFIVAFLFKNCNCFKMHEDRDTNQRDVTREKMCA